MTKPFNSPEEQARLKSVRDSAFEDRKSDKAKALSDWQRIETERDKNTARLKALRLASEAATKAATRTSAPPPVPAKPRIKALRPGQAPNTRRSITR